MSDSNPFGDLTTCDFCGGGCSDPDCQRCNPKVWINWTAVERLAANLERAGMLCWSFQLGTDYGWAKGRHGMHDREWDPGCGVEAP